MVPKNSDKLIKQTYVDVFSKCNWQQLERAEATTRPKQCTIPIASTTVPFFDELREPVSWTLQDAFNKETVTIVLVYIYTHIYVRFFGHI